MHQVIFGRKYLSELMTGNVRSYSNHKNKKNYLEKIGLVTFEPPEFAKIIYLLATPSMS